jgi:hypothetical protein
MLVDLEIQLEASNTKVSLHTMETIAPTCSWKHSLILPSEHQKSEPVANKWWR